MCLILLLLLLLLLLQSHHLGGCAGVHLCDLRHVLRAGQLRGVPHPGARQQGQAHAVHQRRAAPPLLGRQLCVGHGEGAGRRRRAGQEVEGQDVRRGARV